MKTFLLQYKYPILLLALSTLVIWPLIMPGFFNVQDYLQVMRIYEMRQCLENFQIPCRWVPDMGAGFGSPLFNYYGVFPYYIGAFFSFFVGFLGAAKLIFFLPLVLGGVFMYLLAKEFLGGQAAFTAAILYLFAPYRALDVYVRGAITEVFAMTLIIIVLYFFLKLIRTSNRINFLAATFSWAIFLLNHNLMTMLFTPIFFGWVIYWLIIYRKSEKFKKALVITVLSIIFGFLSSSFFLIPALLEQNLIQIDNLKQSEFIPNFRAHFVTLNQLFFSRFWGYGISTWGENDGMSFQIGWPHWQLVIIVVPLLFIQLIKSFSMNFLKNNLLTIIFLIVFISSILMTHNKSAFIWEFFDKLEFVQFPWRFLSITIFAASLLAGSVIFFVKEKYRNILILFIVPLTIFLNFQYFQPEKFEYNISDKDFLSSPKWEFYQQGSLLDYLPKYAQEPDRIAPKMPTVRGKANIVDFRKSSNSFEFKAKVKDRTVIDIPIFYYPNWQIYANGMLIRHSNKGEFGTIQIALNSGDYLIEGNFKDTTIRRIANLLSIGGIISVFFILLSKRPIML